MKDGKKGGGGAYLSEQKLLGLLCNKSNDESALPSCTPYRAKPNNLTSQSHHPFGTCHQAPQTRMPGPQMSHQACHASGHTVCVCAGCFPYDPSLHIFMWSMSTWAEGDECTAVCICMLSDCLKREEGVIR